MTTATKQDKSIDAYLATIPATHRAALKKLRGQIKKRNFVLKLMQVVQTELYRSLSEGSAIAPLSQAVEYQI